jgi:SNF2 family DNA or RNA helicase
MILSPKAGGVGLTLTAANHVIHLSRWWNPAVEDQCTDRVFRIGQNKEVTIYYPQAVHPKYQGTSFDVSLHNLLEKKRELSRQVLVPSTIDSAELKALLDSTTS